VNLKASQSKGAIEDNIKNTKLLLKQKAADSMYFHVPALRTAQESGYRDATDLVEGRDPASSRLKATEILGIKILIRELVDTEARLRPANYNATLLQLQTSLDSLSINPKIVNNMSNVNNPIYKWKANMLGQAEAAFIRYIGSLAELKRLEKRYPAVVNADYKVRADLASPNPNYKISSSGTIISPGATPSAASSAVSAAVVQVSGALAESNASSNRTLTSSSAKPASGVVIPAYLRTAFAEAGIPESNYPAMLLSDQSSTASKTARDLEVGKRNLADSLERQQYETKGPQGFTPVPGIPPKPTVVKTPLAGITPKTPVARTPVAGKGPSAFTGKPPATPKGSGKK
jgi:hypothetical protein